MLAAACIADFFGVDEEDISTALRDYVPTNNRSQLEVTDSNRLIVDTYNANPTSMKAALENFRLMQVDHKMAILGDMRELGEVSHEEHQKVVDFLKNHPQVERVNHPSLAQGRTASTTYGWWVRSSERRTATSASFTMWRR